MEAARLLGARCRAASGGGLAAGPPAVVAGVALVLMETLADFGVASYFGIQTFTTGIYKAWLSMDNRLAAAQLATMLLVVVLAPAAPGAPRPKAHALCRQWGGACGSSEAQPLVLRGGLRVAAWLVCGLPVLMGFVAPIAFMLRPLAADWSVLPWGRFVEWAWHSVRLGGITSALAVAVALTLAFAVRRRPDGVTRGVVQLASLGYAVPGR